MWQHMAIHVLQWVVVLGYAATAHREHPPVGAVPGEGQAGNTGFEESALLGGCVVEGSVGQGDVAHTVGYEPTVVAGGVEELVVVEQRVVGRIELTLPPSGQGDEGGGVGRLPVQPGGDDLDPPGRLGVPGEEPEQRAEVGG